MSLREILSIQLAAIDLGQVSCFDANLFADEIINKVLDAAVDAVSAVDYYPINLKECSYRMDVLRAIDKLRPNQ